MPDSTTPALAAPQTAGIPADTAGQPTTNPIPVLSVNPPVELRQPAGPATGKPSGIGSVVAPSSNPMLGSRPVPRPNNDAETGSNGRERSDQPAPVSSPANPNGFSLTDASSASAATPVPSGQPVPAAQTISQPTATASTTASQPATGQPSFGQSGTSQLPVSHQLAGPVLSLRTAGNGSHQLTIALHPAELGPVNLHVRILGDSMAIQLASTSEGARDALRDALPQLRQELQAAGLPNVDLSLDLGGAPSGGAPSGGHSQTGGHGQAGGHAQAGSEQPGYQEQPISTTARRSTTTESGLDRWL